MVVLQVMAVCVVVALWFGPPTICLTKGKLIFALIGYFGIGLLFVWVGAVRLALPDSRWAQRFYDSDKLARSKARFPESEVDIERDQEILEAWEGVAIDPNELDPITRRALRKAGRI